MGKAIYDDLVKKGRLMIVDEPYTVQELAKIIKTLKLTVPLGAIFIDYVQKIKNKEKSATRQLELQKTSAAILEIAMSCSTPIILGAQLGRDSQSRNKVRLENLRECGDLEQDAQVVLGIFNPSMEDAQAEGKPLTDREIDLDITALKNRNGIANKTISLKFDRPLLKIKETA